MQKIISLFKRDYEGTRQVYDEVVPGAEWVQAGDGRATVKWDGTCCLVRDGKLYKRYDAKHGKQPPSDFEPAQEPDPKTGHWPGWLPVKEDNPGDQWHLAAWREHLSNTGGRPLYDGTYELVGPKIQGNPNGWDRHYLILHGGETLGNVPTTFDALRQWLETTRYEGIVWHHPDGRMVKIKRRDFGLPWPVKE